MPSLDENPRDRAGRRLKRRVAVFAAAIIAAICSLVAEAVVEDHRAALSRARIACANLSAGFEGEVREILNEIAGESQSLKDQIEADAARGQVFDLERWKSKVPELLSPTINVVIMNADGNLIATAVRHVTSASYTDRNYYMMHRDNSNLGLLISEPVYGKTAKRMIIPVTRRLNAQDGSFAGVLGFIINPGLLTGLHRTVDLGKAGALNLFLDDGVMLARYTSNGGSDEKSVGRRIEGIQVLEEAKHGDSGCFARTSLLDGVRRISCWRKVAGYPLIAVAAVSKAEALAHANHQAEIMGGLGAAALSLPLLMMVILNREISRRVRHEIALGEEIEKVRIANKMKSTFLANMSHELRTPLNAILGFSEIIRDKAFGEDADRYAAYADDINQSGAHLLNIVKDILDVTKIEAGKFELIEEAFEFEPALQESLVTVEQQAAAAGVSLESHAPSDTSFFGDRTKLKQIMINLFSNAIKFTPAGGAVRIAVTSEQDGGLCLTIRDTGIGMSGEEIKEALELFHQIDSSVSRRFEGAGLGLPLAVRLTELHGGTLTIESTPNLGTTILVRLPPDRVTWI